MGTSHPYRDLHFLTVFSMPSSLAWALFVKVARLKVAQKHAAEAIKLGKKSKAVAVALTMQVQAIIEARLAKAIKDNQTIYHDREPDADR